MAELCDDSDDHKLVIVEEDKHSMHSDSESTGDMNRTYDSLEGISITDEKDPSESSSEDGDTDEPCEEAHKNRASKAPEAREWHVKRKYLQVTDRPSRSSMINPADLPGVQPRAKSMDSFRQGTMWQTDDLDDYRTFKAENDASKTRGQSKVPHAAYTLPASTAPAYIAPTIAVPLAHRLMINVPSKSTTTTSQETNECANSVVVMSRYTSSRRKLNQTQMAKRTRKEMCASPTDLELFKQWCLANAKQRLCQEYSELIDSGPGKLKEATTPAESDEDLPEFIDFRTRENPVKRVKVEKDENLEQKTSQIIEKVMQEKNVAWKKRMVKDFEPYQPLALRPGQAATLSKCKKTDGKIKKKNRNTGCVIVSDKEKVASDVRKTKNSKGKSAKTSRSGGSKVRTLAEILQGKQKYVEKLVNSLQSGGDFQGEAECTQVKAAKKRNSEAVRIKQEPVDWDVGYTGVTTVEPLTKIPRTELEGGKTLENMRDRVVKPKKLSNILKEKMKLVERLANSSQSSSHENSDNDEVQVTDVKGAKKRNFEPVIIKPEPVDTDDGYSSMQPRNVERDVMADSSDPQPLSVEPLMKIESICGSSSTEIENNHGASEPVVKDEPVETESMKWFEPYLPRSQSPGEEPPKPVTLFRNSAKKCELEKRKEKQQLDSIIASLPGTLPQRKCHFYGLIRCENKYQLKPVEIPSAQRYIEAVSNLLRTDRKTVPRRWQLMVKFARRYKSLLEGSAPFAVEVCGRHYTGIRKPLVPLENSCVCGICGHKTTIEELLRHVNDSAKWLHRQLEDTDTTDMTGNVHMPAIVEAFYVLHGFEPTRAERDLCWACVEKLLCCHLCKDRPNATSLLATVSERMLDADLNIRAYRFEDIAFADMKELYELRGSITKSTQVCEACFELMKYDIYVYKLRLEGDGVDEKPMAKFFKRVVHQ